MNLEKVLQDAENITLNLSWIAPVLGLAVGESNLDIAREFTSTGYYGLIGFTCLYGLDTLNKVRKFYFDRQ